MAGAASLTGLVLGLVVGFIASRSACASGQPRHVYRGGKGARVDRAEALRATREAAPPPLAPPPTLRQERAALWRIAMLCKAALGDRAVRPELHPYFVQIAQVCREGIRREDSNRGDHGT